MAKPLFESNNELDDIIKIKPEENVKQNADSVGSEKGKKVKISKADFNIKPEEMERYLNSYVVGQEEAVEIIATKVCTHFNKMKLEEVIPEEQRIIGNIKSNMLLIGPTGVGKTYIVKLIAKKIGVPFIKADATKFSETGYVGGDVEDLVRDLVHEADGDITKAEYGIIYLDEIDKIASSGNLYGPDVSRTGVQRNLLKLMEESEVDLKTPHDLASQVEAAMEAQKTGKVSRKKINTRNILFIVSGAFNGLNEIINKRLNLQSIGFEPASSSREDKQDILKKTKTIDLIEYGFESEFVGRLPLTVILNDLDKDGLYKILKNKYSSVVLGKKLDFRAYNINLEFTDYALQFFSKLAYHEKTGARGLLNVVEKLLIKFEKALPSTDINQLVVNEDVVNNPETSLQKMLLTDGINNFQREFLLEHGIFLEFEKDAIDMIQKRSRSAKKGIKQLCEDYFREYHYGIKLMGKDSFTITTEAVENSVDYIDKYIRQNYKK